MRRATLLLPVATLALLFGLFAACGGEPVIEDPGIDAGASDAGTVTDAGAKADAAGSDPSSDAGSSEHDAGSGEHDAGVHDAGTHDAGSHDAGTDGQDAGPELDGGPGDAGPHDAGLPIDPPRVKCGSVECDEGEVCCVDTTGGTIDGTCATTCAGPSVLSCDGPEDCGGGEICCGELQTASGFMPSCPIVSANTSCANTCPTSVSLFCPGTSRVRMCHTREDCADDPNVANCCVFSQGGEEVSFCVADFMKSFAIRCDPP